MIYGDVTSIVVHGPKSKLIYPLCLVSKHAQKPFEYNGYHTKFVNELVYVNTCGLFPTASPQGAQYFCAMLEGKITAAAVHMMKRKNEAFKYFKSTIAKWKHILNCPIMFM